MRDNCSNCGRHTIGDDSDDTLFGFPAPFEIFAGRYDFAYGGVLYCNVKCFREHVKTDEIMSMPDEDFLRLTRCVEYLGYEA